MGTIIAVLIIMDSEHCFRAKYLNVSCERTKGKMRIKT